VKRLLIDENLPASLATLLPVDCCHATFAKPLPRGCGILPQSECFVKA
jgi:hypothetical protein